MSLKEILGFGEDRKVRYAIVALGSISQEAMMPGMAHTGNSAITALVTSDATKARELADMYKVEHTYSFEQFDEMLRSGEVDAIYLATPNWRHAEFAVPALRAGIHVLVEKPMEISSENCQKMIDAQQNSSAKLMVAYRLHFEPATVAAIEKVRSGDLGQVHVFSSTFSQMLDPENHRGQTGLLAGPVLDMGPYPINARPQPLRGRAARSLRYRHAPPRSRLRRLRRHSQRHPALPAGAACPVHHLVLRQQA